jgi:hypothetical protein
MAEINLLISMYARAQEGSKESMVHGIKHGDSLMLLLTNAGIPRCAYLSDSWGNESTFRRATATSACRRNVAATASKSRARESQAEHFGL